MSNFILSPVIFDHWRTNEQALTGNQIFTEIDSYYFHSTEGAISFQGVIHFKIRANPICLAYYNYQFNGYSFAVCRLNGIKEEVAVCVWPFWPPQEKWEFSSTKGKIASPLRKHTVCPISQDKSQSVLKTYSTKYVGPNLFFCCSSAPRTPLTAAGVTDGRTDIIKVLWAS